MQKNTLLDTLRGHHTCKNTAAIHIWGSQNYIYSKKMELFCRAFVMINEPPFRLAERWKFINAPVITCILAWVSKIKVFQEGNGCRAREKSEIWYNFLAWFESSSQSRVWFTEGLKAKHVEAYRTEGCISQMGKIGCATHLANLSWWICNMDVFAGTHKIIGSRRKYLFTVQNVIHQIWNWLWWMILHVCLDERQVWTGTVLCKTDSSCCAE